MSTPATASNALEKRARAVVASAAAPDARMAAQEFVAQVSRVSA
jgi:hypothetical protein